MTISPINYFSQTFFSSVNEPINLSDGSLVNIILEGANFGYNNSEAIESIFSRYSGVVHLVPCSSDETLHSKWIKLTSSGSNLTIDESLSSSFEKKAFNQEITDQIERFISSNKGSLSFVFIEDDEIFGVWIDVFLKKTWKTLKQCSDNYELKILKTPKQVASFLKNIRLESGRPLFLHLDNNIQD